MVTRILDGTAEEDPQAAGMKELCSHVAASTVLGACNTLREGPTDIHPIALQQAQKR